MAPVTLSTKRITLSAEVPAVVARVLRRLRRGVPGGAAEGGRLVLGEESPAVGYERRDPRASLPYFRMVRDRMRGAGPGGVVLPEGWGARELEEAVASLWWYHTLELPHGVTTPGTYDHRPLVGAYGLPDSLEGVRVLDVATYDGFWAFEFERRGAEVVACDIPHLSDLDLPGAVRDLLVAEGVDWEIGTGFRLAHQALGSSVKRVEVSIYDLDPSEVGTFDLVHLSDLLLHLRDPAGALAALARVTGGRALITDCYDPAVPAGMSRYSGGWAGATWWLPSLETLVQMTHDAGFRTVEVRRTFNLSTVDAPKGFWRASLLATR